MPVMPPPLLALGAGFVQHALAPDERGGAVRKVAAATVATASVGLLAGASMSFRKHGTTFEPFHPEDATALVTDGPNAVTRNPMYVGMAGLLTAHALYRGGLLTALPVAAFVAVIDRIQVRPEEEALRQKFGEEYDAYRAAVPRWIGPATLSRR
jgi:protein-S-isoprenylcysteine O-methyltransferase Ste14